ncbi:aldo/keto reductase family oxidoreductase [Rhodoferax sp.]|uniref:aldo/keto reductase n=1 Tax=Rhodoferax sp. TaxID=50421 RepID=UPI0026043769|nr:aldo/keto reductase [Rhodoferax sp.]MDD2925205.1 aldo/keto reductase [Rhodoferax sp.]
MKLLDVPDHARHANMRLVLPLLVWGAWRLTRAQLSVQALNCLIHQCVELGITAFDHADIYGGYTAEAQFGQALALSPGLRAQLQLFTKCGVAAVSAARPAHQVKTFNSSADHLAACMDHSLTALGTEQLDLLMLHRPDYLMDAAETAQALDRAVASGKVRAVGVSNFSPSQVLLLRQHLQTPLAVNQIEFSLGAMQALDNGVLDQCQQLGMRPMAWSPLAGGAVLGDNDLARRLNPVLTHIAQVQACPPAAVALAWLMRCPTRVVPVLGSVRIERLRDAWRATQITLSREDWYTLWAAAAGRQLP